MSGTGTYVDARPRVVAGRDVGADRHADPGPDRLEPLVVRRRPERDGRLARWAVVHRQPVVVPAAGGLVVGHERLGDHLADAHGRGARRTVLARHGGDDPIVAQQAQVDAVGDLDRAADEPGVDCAGRDADEAVVEAELPERDAHAGMARSEGPEDLRREVAGAVRHEPDREVAALAIAQLACAPLDRLDLTDRPPGGLQELGALGRQRDTARKALEQAGARAASPGAGSRG